jgi:hypothetical protein
LELVEDTEFANQNVVVISNVANIKHVHKQDGDMDFVNQDAKKIFIAKEEEHAQLQVKGTLPVFDEYPLFKFMYSCINYLMVI